MNKEKIYEELLKGVCEDNIKKDEEMRKHTTFKIGGKADFFIKPTTKEELIHIFNIAKQNNVPITIIGNGSNILVLDTGIRGFVIKPNFKNIEINKIDDECVEVTAGSGVLLRRLAETMLKESIGGLEFAAFIPGCVGGEVRMNAGAHGFEMKDIVKSSKYMDFNGNIHTINNEEHEFSYRKSIFSRIDGIIIETTFLLKYKDKKEILQEMEDHKAFRIEKQPIFMPSAGSTFKRGTGFITAKIIDECGLKGKRVGDAEISTMHAGFVVNRGNATAKDVLELIRVVEQEVFAKTGKRIELELEILG